MAELLVQKSSLPSAVGVFAELQVSAAHRDVFDWAWRPSKGRLTLKGHYQQVGTVLLLLYPQ